MRHVHVHAHVHAHVHVHTSKVPQSLAKQRYWVTPGVSWADAGACSFFCPLRRAGVFEGGRKGGRALVGLRRIVRWLLKQEGGSVALAAAPPRRPLVPSDETGLAVCPCDLGANGDGGGQST